MIILGIRRSSYFNVHDKEYVAHKMVGVLVLTRVHSYINTVR